MTKHWKPILIIGLIAAAVVYLYPSLQFYGMSSAERTLMETSSPERLADLHRRSLISVWICRAGSISCWR